METISIIGLSSSSSSHRGLTLSKYLTYKEWKHIMPPAMYISQKKASKVSTLPIRNGNSFMFLYKVKSLRDIAV